MCGRGEEREGGDIISYEGERGQGFGKEGGSEGRLREKRGEECMREELEEVGTNTEEGGRGAGGGLLRLTAYKFGEQIENTRN